MTTKQDQIDGSTAAADDASAVGVSKRLERLNQGLEALRANGARAAAAAEKTDANWPSDLNTPAFREGVRKRDAPSSWGPDPAKVRTPEAS